MFEVVENPIPQSLSVNSSISSGGIPVEIEFKEEYRLECVQKLWMIFEAVNLVYAEESCEKSGWLMFQLILGQISSIFSNILIPNIPASMNL